MRITKFIHIVAAALTLTLTLAGCSTPKDITYFQDLNNGSTGDLAKPTSIVARPGDRISIMVTSKDQALADIFNAPIPARRLGEQTAELGTSTNGTSNLPSYFISTTGYIDLPVLGEVYVSGLSRGQISSTVRDLIKQGDYIKDPAVYVEFLSNSVTVLGQVKSPGVVTFDKEYMTLVEAIGAAGDLELDGLRTNVLVVRLENGKRKAYRVDLTDAESLYNSPVYYMQQDDWVYVEPNDRAKRSTTVNGNNVLTPAFWMSLASFAMTVAITIVKW